MGTTTDGGHDGKLGIWENRSSNTSESEREKVHNKRDSNDGPETDEKHQPEPLALRYYACISPTQVHTEFAVLCS
jgi:hypothetical protein